MILSAAQLISSTLFATPVAALASPHRKLALLWKIAERNRQSKLQLTVLCGTLASMLRRLNELPDDVVTESDAQFQDFKSNLDDVEEATTRNALNNWLDSILENVSFSGFLGSQEENLGLLCAKYKIADQLDIAGWHAQFQEAQEQDRATFIGHLAQLASSKVKLFVHIFGEVDVKPATTEAAADSIRKAIASLGDDATRSEERLFFSTALSIIDQHLAERPGERSAAEVSPAGQAVEEAPIKLAKEKGKSEGSTSPTSSADSKPILIISPSSLSSSGPRPKVQASSSTSYQPSQRDDMPGPSSRRHELFAPQIMPVHRGRRKSLDSPSDAALHDDIRVIVDWSSPEDLVPIALSLSLEPDALALQARLLRRLARLPLSEACHFFETGGAGAFVELLRSRMQLSRGVIPVLVCLRDMLPTLQTGQVVSPLSVVTCNAFCIAEPFGVLSALIADSDPEIVGLATSVVVRLHEHHPTAELLVGYEVLHVMIARLAPVNGGDLVVRHICNALAILLGNPIFQRAFIAENAVAKLAYHLGSSDEMLVVVVYRSLQFCWYTPAGMSAFKELCMPARLVAHLRSGSRQAGIVDEAAATVSTLAKNRDMCVAMLRGGIAAAIVPLLLSRNHAIIRRAADVVGCIAVHDRKDKPWLLVASAPQALIDQLAIEDYQTLAAICTAISNLAQQHREFLRLFRVESVLQLLIVLLRHTNREVICAVSDAVGATCGDSDKTREFLIREGICDVIIAQIQATRRNDVPSSLLTLVNRIAALKAGRKKLKAIGLIAALGRHAEQGQEIERIMIFLGK